MLGVSCFQLLIDGVVCVAKVMWEGCMLARVTPAPLDFTGAAGYR